MPADSPERVELNQRIATASAMEGDRDTRIAVAASRA